ncbi:predicted protein [Botrytis cinerea T4]|uniref:Uncharacterized protein n=1 Tax=Botryotinia fuckeliana (strain T4) TaxID=999810 RepID=G2YUB1_BOTF4|nr:predicted protein [Botrytis cinerea T4]
MSIPRWLLDRPRFMEYPRPPSLIHPEMVSKDKGSQ